MDDDIEHIDLCADDAIPTFQAPSASKARIPAFTKGPTLGHRNSTHATSTKPSIAMQDLTDGGPSKRRHTSTAMSEDDFQDIDSMTPSPEPRQKPRFGSVQPRSGFRLPSASSTSSSSNEPADSERAELTSPTSPTPAKRKRNALNFAPPVSARADYFSGATSRPSSTAPMRGFAHEEFQQSNSTRGGDTGTDRRRKRNLLDTPPPSAARRQRGADTAAPTFSDNSPQDLHNVASTLDTMTNTIMNLHARYQKPMENLARKVNTLSNRLAAAAAENAALRGHVEETFANFAQQTNKRIDTLYDKFQETIDAMDDQTAGQRPTAGGAYGGPRYTAPTAKPGFLSRPMQDNSNRQRR